MWQGKKKGRKGGKGKEGVRADIDKIVKEIVNGTGNPRVFRLSVMIGLLP